MSDDIATESPRQKGSPLLVLKEGSSQHRLYQTIGWAFLVIPALLVPYVLASFRVGQMAQAVGWGVAILGMNLVIGYSGLISLGHIAFTGLGAYTTVILINESRWDWWMTLPVVFVVCFLFGVLVGLPALKIKGLYLALVTLALAYTFPILLKIDQGGIARRTGGDNGRNLDERLFPTEWVRKLLRVNGTDADLSTRANTFKYFVMLFVAALCFLFIRNMMKSRPGRGMIAIRDNQIGAAVSGVNLTKHKVITFGVSAAIAGIGGSMLAGALDSVGPTSFGFEYAILTLMGLVLGGVATLHGAWIGGLLVVFLQDFAPRIVTKLPGSPDVVYARAVFGVLLVLVAFFAPGGIVAFSRKLKSKLVRVEPKVPELKPFTPAPLSSEPTRGEPVGGAVH